jgi:hypothetical protein
MQIKLETRLLLGFLGHKWLASAVDAGVLFNLIGV